MRLSALYKDPNRLDISIELFPPKTTDGMTGLFEKVERLRALRPAFFSMTYGAGGSTADKTLGLVDRLKNKSGVETMCHLTVVGQSRKDTCAILERLQEMGVYNLIALGGDPPKGRAGWLPPKDAFPFAKDLVREARKRAFFSIAVAGFPEIHPAAPDRETDIRYLKEKVDAGADAVITQLFFDNRFYYDYLECVRKAGIKVPVIPGLLPILSVGQVRRFTALCKSKIPEAVTRKLAAYEDDDEAARQYGVELTTHQCEGLRKYGVPGIHFYALNQSQSVEAVLKNLNLG